LRCHWLTACLVILCGTITAAHGSPAVAGANEASRPTVELVLVTRDEASASALEDALRVSLQRLGAKVDVDRVGALSAREVATAIQPASVAATAWIDLTATDAATVYVSDGKNVFSRQFDLGATLDSVALDLLEVVVTSSVEAILSGRPLGVPREEFARLLDHPAPPPPEAPVAAVAPPAPPPTQPERTLELSAAVFAQGAWIAPGKLVAGPGVRVDGRKRGLWCALSAVAVLPYQASTEGVTLHLLAQELRLSIGRLFSLRPDVALIVALGAGLDITRVRSTTTELDVASAGSFFVTDFIVRPSAELERRFGRFKLAMLAGLDVDPIGATYVIKLAPGTRSVWTPWRVRPLLALLLGIAL
jgi:hypothetical protein